jgi:glycosyltransferase involved in cell wall biosynthesis
LKIQEIQVHKIAFVIPTKDRPSDLKKMLNSIAEQEKKPDQIIVVDGSMPTIKNIVDSFHHLEITYITIYPPSLAIQRNAGMALLRKDITLAGYLDDDIILEKDAIKNMLKFWDKADSNIGGTVFNITNTLPPKWTRIKSIFFLDSPTPGKVLTSGCTSILGNQKKNNSVDWLCGGATVWKREIIGEYYYDEWFKGTGYLEDVDFSFNVKHKYSLFLVANAKLAHYSRAIKLDKQFVHGKWQIYNRMYLVRKYKNRGLSIFKAWVASFALVAMHLSIGLLRMDKASLLQCLGNLAAISREAFGKSEEITDYLK